MPYLIGEETFALLPNSKGTKIIEEYKSFIVNEATPNIVDRNCYMNGSSFLGRQKGSAYLIGTSYKPPILINGYKNIILIPTHSIRNKKCAWLNFHTIVTYYENNQKKTIVELKNSKKVVLEISYNIFDKQIARATRLEYALKGYNKQKHL